MVQFDLGLVLLPCLWKNRGMKHIPQHGEAVTLNDRKGGFVITGIDAIHKTVDVRTVADPMVFIKEVSWSVISHR